MDGRRLRSLGHVRLGLEVAGRHRFRATARRLTMGEGGIPTLQRLVDLGGRRHADLLPEGLGIVPIGRIDQILCKLNLR
jgi:hypothetical protein